MTSVILAATPSKTEPDRCAYCGQHIYPTQTAHGTRMAHIDTKVLFCSGVSDRWRQTMAFLVEDCGLDSSGTETLVRLAASVADAGDYDTALMSFSEPDDVDSLAVSVAERLSSYRTHVTSYYIGTEAASQAPSE